MLNAAVIALTLLLAADSPIIGPTGGVPGDLWDMFPTSTAKNVVDYLTGDTKFNPQFPLCNSAIDVSASNFDDLFRIQSSPRQHQSGRASSFDDFVLNVVIVCSNEQMVNCNTWWIVAFVANNQTSGYRAICQFPSNAMCSHHLASFSSRTNGAITASRNCPRPQNTTPFIRFAEILSKTNFQRNDICQTNALNGAKPFTTFAALLLDKNDPAMLTNGGSFGGGSNAHCVLQTEHGEGIGQQAQTVGQSNSNKLSRV